MEPAIQFVVNLLPYVALVTLALSILLFCREFVICTLAYVAGEDLNVFYHSLLVCIGCVITMLVSGVILQLSR
jgi:hypothetical protein